MDPEQGNIGLVHAECASEYYEKWQRENKDRVIKVGEYAKLAFKHMDGSEGPTERMWVLIEEVYDQTRFRGLLSNHPRMVIGWEFADEVEFTRDEIQDMC